MNFEELNHLIDDLQILEAYTFDSELSDYEKEQLMGDILIVEEKIYKIKMSLIH